MGDWQLFSSRLQMCVCGVFPVEESRGEASERADGDRGHGEQSEKAEIGEESLPSVQHHTNSVNTHTHTHTHTLVFPVES